jgi:alkylglycerol monooxygenase
MAKVIVFASPVFFLLIAIEWWWSVRVARQPGSRANLLAGGPAVGYRFNDAVANLGLGMASQVVGLLTKGVMVTAYALVFDHISLFPGPASAAFWQSVPGFVLALLLYDFCYYWLHRLGHEMGVLWAAHVVHHQSQTFNLSTALRQTSSGFLLSWVFYLPLAALGVPPAVFGAVALVDLLYQFWVHTEYVGKLGWFDRWFCSPSNHRVHHAVNERYLDKNYGGVLIIWDRLFGSFIEEDERCIYGTRAPLESWDPLWANLEVYAALWRDCVAAPRWRDKLLVWFKHPGWRPEGLAQSQPKPPFRMDEVRTFNPPMDAMQWAVSIVLYGLLLAAVVVLLDASAYLPDATTAATSAGVVAGLWALCAAMQGRIGAPMAALVALSVLATLSAVFGWTAAHYLFKPGVMVVAIWFIAVHAHLTRANRQNYHPLRPALLLAALVFSLAGDVLLMLPGKLFIPGLAAFLVAHLFYIALFRSDARPAPWFPSTTALVCTLLAAVAMYATVYPGLNDAVMRVAVAAYALAIALMAAQALGRATLLQTRAARRVGMGACLFMASDSLIAIHRFVQPLPMSAFWILATYYAAQLLIVGNALGGSSDARTSPSTPNTSLAGTLG